MSAEQIIRQALTLPPAEKARIVDELLSSLDQPDEAIDALWRKEVEDRTRLTMTGLLSQFPSRKRSQNIDWNRLAALPPHSAVRLRLTVRPIKILRGYASETVEAQPQCLD